METIEKKRVTLSLPVETDKTLERLAMESGMTKSGLVNYLVNSANAAGSIYK